MNRFLSILCLLIVCIGCLAKSFTYNYKGVAFKCKIDKNSVCITSFNVDANIVTVPSMVAYKGVTYPVKKISTFINGNNYLAKTLIIEEGIEEIDNYSFNEFRQLKTVLLPSTIKVVGRNAFRDNEETVFNLPSTIVETALRSGSKITTTYVENNSDLLAQAEIARAKAEQARKEAEELEQARKAQANKDLEQARKEEQKAKAELDIARKSYAQDIDINIPLGNKRNIDTYCVIIANEKYEEVPPVDFAENDGQTFKTYCTKTLGIPDKQIRSYINASYTDMKRALNWIEDIARVTMGKAKIIVYYAGHGIPSESDNSAYLMPADCYPKDITTCFKLRDIYQRLGNLKAQSVTVFLDACFSGMQRGDNKALFASRGVATRPREESLTGNVVVFSASSNDETALAFNDQKHGLFTYHLLLKLKETKGIVSLGELYESVSTNVQKSSLIENDKLQTPSVNTSVSMKDKWTKLYF